MTIPKLRSTLAFALVLWCAGTGCLVMRYGYVKAMTGEALDKKAELDQTNQKLATKSMADHACCKARHRALRNRSTSKSDSVARSLTVTLSEESFPSRAISCCPLMSGSFVVASRGPANDNDESAPVLTSSHERNYDPEFLASRLKPPRLPNHEHTYLVCCAFLI